MTKVEEFKTRFKEVVGKDAIEFKNDPKEFRMFLNQTPELRTLFREAVEECGDTSKEDTAAMGLSALFPND